MKAGRGRDKQKMVRTHQRLHKLLPIKFSSKSFHCIMLSYCKLLQFITALCYLTASLHYAILHASSSVFDMLYVLLLLVPAAHCTLDSLVEETKKGNFVPIGRDDILTSALGTAEHGGQVRGVGR
ncbi:hypothetical protein L195_g053306, partial [Trifolium pratense]